MRLVIISLDDTSESTVNCSHESRSRMDVLPVMIQAAAVIGNAALGESAKRVVGQAWDSTMQVIRGRLGSDHPAPALLEELPSASASGLRTLELRDRLMAMHLDWDSSIEAAVARLQEAVKQPTTSVTVNAHSIPGAGVVYGNVNITNQR